MLSHVTLEQQCMGLGNSSVWDFSHLVPRYEVTKLCFLEHALHLRDRAALFSFASKVTGIRGT